MALEFALLAAAALGIVVYGMHRRKNRVFHEDEHQAELICIVSFHDRSVTLPLIDAFFEQEYIKVRDLKREIKSVNGVDLFTNTYRLSMPRRVNQGQLVGYLSSLTTVQSVKIRPR